MSVARRRLVGISAAAILAAGAAWWLRAPAVSLPGPPVVDLSQVAPEVAEHVREARQQVLENRSEAETWGRLGMVFQAYDFVDEATACLAEAERLDPDDSRWPYLLGVNQSVLAADEAVTCLERAAHLDPQFLHARFRLAELLLREGRVEEAARHIEAARGIDAQHPRTQLLLAHRAWLEGRDDECRRWAETSAAAAPGQRATHELLARVYHRLGDRDAAQGQLALLAQLPPGKANWDDPLVAEILEMRRDPQWTVARALRSLQAGRNREAILLLRGVVERHPDVPDYSVELGRALLVSGAHLEAADVLDRALRRHPGAADLHRLRGAAHSVGGDWSSAAECFRAALERKPDNAIAWENLGVALQNLDDVSGAADAFGRAVQYDSTLVSAQTHLGRLLLNSGRRDEALLHLRTAAQLAPQERAVRELLEQAEGM